jgi:hypothetical protein
MANISIIDPDNGSGTDYTSLSAWEADLPATLTDDETAQCRSSSGSNDTTKAVISGITMAGYTLRVERHADESKGAVWDDAGYILENTSDSCMNLAQEGTVEIDGIQVSANSSSYGDDGIEINAGASALDLSINAVLVKKSQANGNDQSGIKVNSGTGTLQISNCLVIDFDTNNSEALSLSASSLTISFHSCTVHNCKIGIKQTTGTVNGYNTICFENDDDFSGTFNTLDYCASDDGDGTNSVQPSNWANVFEDYTSDDFRLKSSDTDCKDSGSSGSAWFTDDVLGNTRTGTWDIGFFEYGAGGTTAPPTTLAPTSLAPTTAPPAKGILIGGKLVNNSILFGRLVQ